VLTNDLDFGAIFAVTHASKASVVQIRSDELAEARVRSNLVELSPELFDQDLRIDPILEPLHRHAFIAQLAVEDSFEPFCHGL
jgi:predicted nuclease of predicted toxin-antitoxin system